MKESGLSFTSNRITQSGNKLTHFDSWVLHHSRSILGEFRESKHIVTYTHTTLFQVKKLSHFSFPKLHRKVVVEKGYFEILPSDRAIIKSPGSLPLIKPNLCNALQLVGRQL